MNDKFVFTSSVVDLAEEQDYLTLRNKVCFFNDKNLNGVQLDYDTSTEEKCKTLINMPVVAKYRRIDNQDDLGGHEVKVVDGKVKFGTATIGVVTGIEIVVEEVETTNGVVKTLPVLYADERVWTRNENCTKAIRRLYLEEKLHSSWEVKTSEYNFKDNVKHLVDYSFLSNCLLGTRSYPAYGKKGAIVTEVSETANEYEYLAAESLLGEALALDLESASASNINRLDDTNRKEGPSMDVNENAVVDTFEEGAVEETAETNEIEDTATAEINDKSNDGVAEVSEGDPVEESTTEDAEAEEAEKENSSMKTDFDIRQMLEEAVAQETVNDDYWYSVAFVFPEEHVVMYHAWRMPDLRFLKFNYEINGDDVSLSNREVIELVISPLNINSEIENKNNALAEANSRIEELTRYKEELEKIKAEQASAERAEAVNKLREYVVKSGRFTEEEITSENVQNAINSLNEAWIKSEIADRLVASMAETHNDSTVTASKSAVNDSTVSILLSSSEKDNTVTGEDIINRFFNRE